MKTITNKTTEFVPYECVLNLRIKFLDTIFGPSITNDIILYVLFCLLKRTLGYICIQFWRSDFEQHSCNSSFIITLNLINATGI